MLGPILQPNSLIHRLCAVVGVALVLCLSVLSIRADLHDALCHHAAKVTSACGHDHGQDANQPQSDHGADGCVISLFAHGHVLAALILVLLFALRMVRAAAFTVADFAAPLAPAYRLPHGCGPPLV